MTERDGEDSRAPRPWRWTATLALLRRHFAAPGAVPALLTRIPRGSWGAFAAASALVLAFLGVASRTTLWDRDEARFAQATVEMVRSGDYLVPTFNGALRPDKPILIYWLMSLPVRLFGPGEVAVRFWAPVALGWVFLLTWAAGRRLFSARAGLVAGFVLATTPLALVAGTAATTDAVLLAFVTLAFVTFARAFLEGWRPLHGVVIAAALAGGLLTKGPVGLAVPLLSMAMAGWLGRREGRLGRRHALWIALAAVVAIGAFLAWALPANRATGGEFARLGLGRHVLQRSLEPLESHGGAWLLSLPYYPLVGLVTFFPWTLHLGGAVSALAGGRLGSPARALLLGWLLPTLVLMTLVATKLPHYVLPVWPALALAVAGTLRAEHRGELSATDRRWLARGVWWTGAAGLALGGALFVAPWWLPSLAPRGAFFAAGLLLAVSTGVAVAVHHRRRYAASFVVLAGGTVLTGALVLAGVVPAIERLKIAPPLAAAVRERTPESVPVATYHYGEPSLVFYLRRGPVEVVDSPDELRSWTAEAGPGVLVLPHSDVALVAGRGLVPLAEVAGYDFTKGRPLRLVALRRE